MAKVLVAYVSRTGCAAEVAERMGAAIRGSGLDVDVLPVARRPDPSDYEAVIIGSGIRGMRWYPSAKGWVASNAEALRDREVAFFSVGLTPVRFPEMASRIAAFTFSLIVDTGVTPVSGANFKGCFDPSKLNAREIAVVRVMGVDEGDYREWDVIDAWALEMAARIVHSLAEKVGR